MIYQIIKKGNTGSRVPSTLNISKDLLLPDLKFIQGKVGKGISVHKG